MDRQQWRLWLVMLGILFCITSCASNKQAATANPSLFCQQLLLRQQMIEHLTSDGIQVLQQGEEVTLILPADKFFYPYSNHMQDNATIYLDKVINFINTYRTEDIAVTGYTDNIGDSLRNLALSRAQAQSVVNYLWKHGLNTRLISAHGKGCADTVASNVYSVGRKANRRIVIFFRLPPPDNVFQ